MNQRSFLLKGVILECQEYKSIARVLEFNIAKRNKHESLSLIQREMYTCSMSRQCKVAIQSYVSCKENDPLQIKELGGAHKSQKWTRIVYAAPLLGGAMQPRMGKEAVQARMQNYTITHRNAPKYWLYCHRGLITNTMERGPHFHQKKFAEKMQNTSSQNQVPTSSDHAICWQVDPKGHKA